MTMEYFMLLVSGAAIAFVYHRLGYDYGYKRGLEQGRKERP